MLVVTIRTEKPPDQNTKCADSAAVRESDITNVSNGETYERPTRMYRGILTERRYFLTWD